MRRDYPSASSDDATTRGPSGDEGRDGTAGRYAFCIAERTEPEVRTGCARRVSKETTSWKPTASLRPPSRPRCSSPRWSSPPSSSSTSSGGPDRAPARRSRPPDHPPLNAPDAGGLRLQTPPSSRALARPSSGPRQTIVRAIEDFARKGPERLSARRLLRSRHGYHGVPGVRSGRRNHRHTCRSPSAWFRARARPGLLRVATVRSRDDPQDGRQAGVLAVLSLPARDARMVDDRRRARPARDPAAPAISPGIAAHRAVLASCQPRLDGVVTPCRPAAPDDDGSGLECDPPAGKQRRLT